MSAGLHLLVLFLFIQFSAFFCYWLLNWREQKMIGRFLFNKYRGAKEKFIALYARPDSDFLRFNLDLSILIAVSLVFLPLAANGYWIFFNKLILFFAYFYIIYLAVIFFVFKRVPSLKSDLEFAKIGMMVAKDKLIFFILIIVVVLIGLWLLSDYLISSFYFLLKNTQIKWPLYAGLGISLLLGFYKLLSYPYDKSHLRTAYSPILHFIKNLKYSKRYDHIYEKKASFFENLNQYHSLKLEQSPNIIIVAVESYGAVILQSDYFKTHFEKTLTELEESIEGKQWHMQSIFSEAPIFAGGSWLCYSSFLYGIPIKDIALYNVLFKNHKAFEKYDSLLHYLKQNGYQNNLLTPIGGYDKSIDWDMIEKAYQYDKFYGFNELDYQGKTLSFIKLGKVAPDEYAINYSYEKIKEQGIQPFSLFFSTLNSHCFFDTPIHTKEDWKDYQKEPFESTGESKDKLEEKYKLAIDYQINFLKNFIVKQDPENTIFILFGDHQPPFVAKKENGNHTLLHVLSKNNTFAESFKKHGFSSSIQELIKKKNTIKHEAFYSMFMQELSNNYGLNKDVQFKIYKEGIDLN